MNAYRKIKFTTPGQIAGQIAGIIAIGAALLLSVIVC
jgi:hypothetical protein